MLGAGLVSLQLAKAFRNEPNKSEGERTSGCCTAYETNR
jgi:hypothetical protein